MVPFSPCRNIRVLGMNMPSCAHKIVADPCVLVAVQCHSQGALSANPGSSILECEPQRDPRYCSRHLGVPYPNPASPLGTPEDIWKFQPWRSPGLAPVSDPCGMAGGSPFPNCYPNLIPNPTLIKPSTHTMRNQRKIEVLFMLALTLVVLTHFRTNCSIRVIRNCGVDLG